VEKIEEALQAAKKHYSIVRGVIVPCRFIQNLLGLPYIHRESLLLIAFPCFSCMCCHCVFYVLCVLPFAV
jgi:hypothetical protein